MLTVVLLSCEEAKIDLDTPIPSSWKSKIPKQWMRPVGAANLVLAYGDGRLAVLKCNRALSEPETRALDAMVQEAKVEGLKKGKGTTIHEYGLTAPPE